MSEQTKSNIKSRLQRTAKAVAKDVLVVGTIAVAVIAVTAVYQQTRAHFDPAWGERLGAEMDAEWAALEV